MSAKDHGMNLVFSYGVEQDKEFEAKGYKFLGAGKDKAGVEVHVFEISEKDRDMSKRFSKMERQLGRSEGYRSMSSEDQWAEDKRLGILDWDGTKEGAEEIIDKRKKRISFLIKELTNELEKQRVV